MIRWKLRKRGVWWHADLHSQGHRVRRALGTRSRGEAESRVRVIVKREIDRQLHGSTIPLGELVVKYLDQARVEKRSWRNDVYLAHDIIKHFGSEKMLDSISVADVQAFKIELAKTVSPATVNRHLALLKTMFNRAINLELYHAQNPVCKVKLFQESPRQEYFTVEEIRRLLTTARQVSDQAKPGSPSRYFVYVLAFAVFTGMRLSEILTLRWDSIRDGFATVRAEHSKSKRARHIPLATPLVEILDGLPRIGEFVFPIRHSPDVIKLAWQRTLSRSNVKPRRFHDLRHSFVTLLIQAGVDPQTVRELAGHSTLSTTGLYSHSSDERKAEAIKCLPL